MTPLKQQMSLIPFLIEKDKYSIAAIDISAISSNLKGAIPNVKYVALVGYFTRIPIFRPSKPSPFSPCSLSLRLTSEFTPAVPFLKEVNKKLSYRGQNALCVIKTNECNTNSERNTVFICTPVLAGRIMFSTCAFVRLSVYSFVRLLPTCERNTSKTNEPFSMQIGTNLSPGQGHGESTAGVRSLKVEVTGSRSYVWKPGEDTILDPLSRVDRDIQ